jgi:hypothetical protein
MAAVYASEKLRQDLNRRLEINISGSYQSDKNI